MALGRLTGGFLPGGRLPVEHCRGVIFSVGFLPSRNTAGQDYCRLGILPRRIFPGLRILTPSVWNKTNFLDPFAGRKKSFMSWNRMGGRELHCKSRPPMRLQHYRSMCNTFLSFFWTLFSETGPIFDLFESNFHSGRYTFYAKKVLHETIFSKIFCKVTRSVHFERLQIYVLL